MNRIGVKLALFFLAIILVSTALSFTAVSLLSQQVVDEVARDQLVVARAIQALRNRTEFTLEDILAIVSDRDYAIRRVEVLDPEEIPREDLARLEADEIVRIDRSPLRGISTMMRFGDAYVSIELEQHRNVVQIWFSRLWSSIALYVVVSTVLILVLANKVVYPVLELTEATQKVARGDFDVQIDTRRNDEIGHLTSNFNHMVRELRTIEYLRRDFISNVSHELKTPLAAIRGYARLLEDDGISREERREYAAVIGEEASRLANMATTMLSLSRLESQEVVSDVSTFSLDEQIRQTILLLESQWARKRITFNIELVAVGVTGNEDLLQQVWVNLIGNAIKFSPEEGTIDVTLQRNGERIEVTVRDRGIGIDGEDLPRVFEKFFQVDRTRAGEGSGLGLSLVKRIVGLFQGEVSVESELGKGSAFTVKLPDGKGDKS